MASFHFSPPRFHSEVQHSPRSQNESVARMEGVRRKKNQRRRPLISATHGIHLDSSTFRGRWPTGSINGPARCWGIGPLKRSSPPLPLHPEGGYSSSIPPFRWKSGEKLVQGGNRSATLACCKQLFRRLPVSGIVIGSPKPFTYAILWQTRDSPILYKQPLIQVL